jgi:hypothetical protein
LCSRPRGGGACPRDEHAVLPAVIVASVAALVSARIGHDLRVAADERFWFACAGVC